MASLPVSIEAAAERTGIAPRVLRSLIDALDHPKVRRIVIYGSRGRGEPRYWSDIDVAVYAPGLTPADHQRIGLDFEAAPIVFPTDLVFYDETASVALRHAIDRDGLIIYERVSVPSLDTSR